MIDDTNERGLINFIKSMHLPQWVTKNVLTAIGKGIQGIIIEATDIPKNLLHNYNEKIKLSGEIKRDFIKKAAQYPLTQLENNPEFAQRALANYGIKILDEQLNKESIAGKTLENLKTFRLSETNDEKSISDDWLTSFWNLAATKSEEDIQSILSKILANEIFKPGSLSLHTLQTLSILDSKVGHSFEKLCNISIDDGEMAFVIHPNVFHFQNIGNLDDYNISFNDLLYLDGANLIRSAETIMLNFGESNYNLVDYASRKAKLNVSARQLHLIYFTQAGKELRGLIKMHPLDIYTQALQNKLGESFQLLE
jgi:hypothetical protein